jgi:hypothetical protein
MMCEAWRLGNATKLMKGKKTNDERKEVFLSNPFQEHIENAKITRNPDIYYQNPFTNKYQHLFRIVGNDLIMHPSCVVNSVKGSVNLHCTVKQDVSSGMTSVSWIGDFDSIKPGIHPSQLFI